MGVLFGMTTPGGSIISPFKTLLNWRIPDLGKWSTSEDLII